LQRCARRFLPGRKIRRDADLFHTQS
jgi:hypothetical protein